MLLTIGLFANCCHRLILDNETFEVTDKIDCSNCICQKTVRQTVLERLKRGGDCIFLSIISNNNYAVFEMLNFKNYQISQWSTIAKSTRYVF